MCAYIYIYIYTHIYIHIYTYIYLCNAIYTSKYERKKGFVVLTNRSFLLEKQSFLGC